MKFSCQKLGSATVRTTIFSTIFLGLAPSAAFACGGIFDVDCNLHHGGMDLPNLKNQTNIIVNQATRPITEAGVTAAGNALAQWMIASRNSAINGAMPIPQGIRQELTGYASEDSMNRVRYKIGDNGFANLASNLERGGLATAVTLIDVIIFRGPSEASSPSLWAHELTHVDQYTSYGVQSFAVQYVRNYSGIENPAYAKENGYNAWSQQQNVNQGGSGTVAAQQVGAFCYVGANRFGPGPPQPYGAQCFVNFGRGPVYGQIGP
jgi:hypothetical protein